MEVRYRLGARWYDVLSLEWLLYKSARLRAIELAAPEPGDRVLDVGCGTGLSLPPLLSRLGAEGRVVALDASGPMLAQARRRSGGDRRVELVPAGAGDLDQVVEGRFDVVTLCYALAIVPGHLDVWRTVLGLVRPGGRVAVVDTALPTGVASPLAPLAWSFLRMGGVDPSRRVWDLVLDQTRDAVHEVSRHGHVHLAVGTVGGSP